MQLVMDSLRYWVGAMGVDGFRFDLGAVLGRDSVPMWGNNNAYCQYSEINRVDWTAPETEGFTVPRCRTDDWHLIIETAQESAVIQEAVADGSRLQLPPRSMKMLVAGGGLQLHGFASTTSGGLGHESGIDTTG